MSKTNFLKFAVIGFISTAVLTAEAFAPDPKISTQNVSPPTDDKEKSLAAFKIILSVLKNPRCINCHPSGDVPHQGNDQHLHRMGVVRGVANQGGIIQKCNTCHHQENMPYSNVPGAPKWGLAPRSMGWYGLTDAQIGQALMDKTKNGNRTPKDLVQHMGFDSLVMWGWNPGFGRTPVPVPIDEFRKTLNEWLQTGAHVPTN